MALPTITAANVIKSSSGSTAIGVLDSGVTVTQGAALYLTAAGKLGLADANGVAPINTFAGIALSAGSPGQTIAYCNGDSGAFTIGASGMTVGAAIYLSTTAGELTQTLPTTATSVIVGNCLSATTMTVTVPGLVGGTTA